MIQLPLSPVANQSMSARLGDEQWDITIKETNAAMCATIARAGVTLVSGLTIVAGTPILPYRYQEHGNLILLTEDDALPFWDAFGTTQTLLYVTAEELADARA